MATAKTKAGRNKARGSKTATKAKGGIDRKQQSALNRGGSLAQRNSSEGSGPGPDAPDEITSAAPPNDKNMAEAGRASSPMFDEAPTGGKEKNETTAKRPVRQEVKAGDTKPEDKVPDITRVEDLPAGSTVKVLAEEVQLDVAIAGGGRKIFHGFGQGEPAFKAAFAAYNDFAENGPAVIDIGMSSEDAKNRETFLRQEEDAALERSREDLKRRGVEAD